MFLEYTMLKGNKHQLLLLLLLLSRFNHVQLCATPETAAHEAPPPPTTPTPSLGFSRQEHWSGLPFLSPMHESESEVALSCPTLSNPMDCSLPGSSVHGIFQARVLEYARTSENSSLDNLISCVRWLAFCVNLASQNTQLFKH